MDKLLHRESTVTAHVTLSLSRERCEAREVIQQFNSFAIDSSDFSLVMLTCLTVSRNVADHIVIFVSNSKILLTQRHTKRDNIKRGTVL